MARVVGVANQKGGVAKTTTVHALGYALAELGRRVLLVDLDPQACLTFSVGIDPEGLDWSLHDVFVRKTKVADVRRPVAGIDGLDIAHLPERGGEPEVDFVLTVGTKRIPIEVKYQNRLDPVRDIRGLQAFLEKPVNSAAFGLVVTQSDTEVITDQRVVALPLSSLMLLR